MLRSIYYKIRHVLHRFMSDRLYCLVGLVIKLLPTRKRGPATVNRCAVLGGGRELNALCDSSHSFGMVYLCNFTSKTLKSSCVKSFVLKNPISTVSNIVEETLNIIDIITLKGNISSVFFVGFEPGEVQEAQVKNKIKGTISMNGRKSKMNKQVKRNTLYRKRKSARLNIYGKKVEYLPPELDQKFTYSLGNTGIIAVHLAALRYDEIHCYGFNFYSGGYVYGSLSENMSAEEEKSIRAAHNKLLKNFERLAAYWQNKVFYLYTYKQNLLLKEKNIRVVKISN